MIPAHNFAITLVQPNVVWKDRDANIEKYNSMLMNLVEATDLIVFPEMFTTGFCTEPEKLAETMSGVSVSWMRMLSQKLQCSVCGSLIIEENGAFFNRLIIVSPDHTVHCYDKRHLFAISGEERAYQAGTKKLIVSLHGWRFYFQICYDLRFPVWSRNCDDYDVLVNTANWPAARSYVWDTLLRARAIENQCYAVGINRVGRDGNGLRYTGNSKVYGPRGMTLAELTPKKEEIVTVHLPWKEIEEFREGFPVWKDRDKFILQ
jgi:predicted amidohydrolase